MFAVKLHIRHCGSDFCHCLTGFDINKCFGPLELVQTIASFCFSGDYLKRKRESLKLDQDFNLCPVEILPGHVSTCH
jgi:hypothetical protein